MMTQPSVPEEATGPSGLPCRSTRDDMLHGACKLETATEHAKERQTHLLKIADKALARPPHPFQFSDLHNLDMPEESQEDGASKVAVGPFRQIAEACQIQELQAWQDNKIAVEGLSWGAGLGSIQSETLMDIPLESTGLQSEQQSDELGGEGDGNCNAVVAESQAAAEMRVSHLAFDNCSTESSRQISVAIERARDLIVGRMPPPRPLVLWQLR